MQRRRRQLDLVDQLGGTSGPVRFGANTFEAQRLTDDVDGREMRIQRAVRVLEDHLHARAEGLEGPLLHPGDVDPVDEDPSRRRCQQPDDGLGDGRLPAAGLADDREGLALVDAEADTVDSAEGAGGDGILDDQVVDGQQAHAGTP